jgi:lambda family phage tail tape measure protein
MAKKIQAVLELDTKKAEGGVNRLKGALTGLAAGIGAKEIIGLADQFTNLQNRIRAVTDTEAEAASAFKLIQNVAKDTRSDLSAVGALFSDLTIATEEMGLSQQEVAGIASTFSKALKISGADANASAGAIRQFGQALASGVLRGDEFNSIMEANPTFMRNVAKQLGVTTGELRKMAEEGQLTSDVLVAATDEIADTIDADFGKTLATVGDAFTNIKNNIIALLGEIESRTGLFAGIAASINLIAENLNFVGAAIAFAFGSAAVGVIAQGVVMFNRVAKAIRGAAGAAVILQAVTGVGLAKALGGLAAGTAAFMAIEATADDATESVSDLNAEMGDAPELDENNTSAKELVDKRKEQTDEEKKIKKEQDEQVRILARQREEFNAITGELAIQSQEFADSLDLQTRLLTALEDEQALIQGTADIEADRAEALRDLNDLTLISADERATKEAEINDEYDERLRLLAEQVELENEITRAVEQRERLAGAVNDISVRISDLMLLDAMQKTFDSDERVRMQERHDLAQQIALDEIALEDKYRNIRLAKEIELGRELNATELAFLKERFDEEKKELDDINAIRLLGLTDYLNKLDEVNEQSRSFGQGFQEAFMRLNDEFTNMAEFGGRIVDTMAQGFTDSIMNFVETGKLSFKDLFQSLLAEIVKMLANRAFLALFSPEGGVFGNLFAGFFEHGGQIPPGKFGIAGEAGPELVRGPATVVSTRDTAQMMAGGAPVTYNINAVDARSFQQLVAADPEFIYNVTRAGARRMPAR